MILYFNIVTYVLYHFFYLVLDIYIYIYIYIYIQVPFSLTKGVQSY